MLSRCSSVVHPAGAKHLLLMVEKNPNALVAMFNVSDTVDTNFSTRAKMGQSSDVYAVAVMNDGKAFFAKKEIKALRINTPYKDIEGLAWPAGCGSS